MIVEITDRLLSLDRQLSSRLCVAERPGMLRTLTAIVTHSGDAFSFLSILATLFLLGGPEWRLRVVVLVATDLITFVVTQVIKVAIRRTRPAGEWGQIYRHTDPYSFPSGHSARGGAMAAMGLILGPAWFGGVLVMWGVALALSRVSMGVHYLSDAIGGFLIGVGVAAALAMLV